jgi:WD40 repeat protein
MELEAAIAFTDTLVFAQTGTHLSDLQQAILQASWSLQQRQSYENIADAYGYSATYLKHDVGPKLWKLISEVLAEKVSKTNFRTAIERRYQESLQAELPPQTVPTSIAEQPQPSLKPTEPSQSIAQRQDWGEAVDVNHFYGRQSELTQLTHWIAQDRCRLVALLGIGGMGKTALSVKLAQQLLDAEPTFEVLIWRSLRNAPPLQDLLTDWLQVLQQRPAETVEGKLAQVLQQLRSHRCLLVLDNVETITSQADSKEYGSLFQQIGETQHQSCLILTSREKPPEVAVLEGSTLPVRSWPLAGLSSEAGQELCQLKGEFQADDADWQKLIAGYSGNPLALKMISTTIQTLFDGKLANFLQQETLVFGTIRNLIEQQFNRLSPIEKTVMNWLAINREWTAFAELRADLFPAIPLPGLIEAVESLEHRSLVEKNSGLFSLQPVVMEYVTDRFVDQIAQEIQSSLDTKSISTARNLLLKTHVLLKAQAKDYIRDAQLRLILMPVFERLLAEQNKSSLRGQLLELLSELQNYPSSEIGYTSANLLALLFQIQPILENCDLSHLPIRQVDFRHVYLQNVNLTEADLTKSIFAETLGIVFTVAFSPDGSILATGDAEGGLRLWQTQDGKLVLNLTGHQGWVWSVVFSSDGQRLASCSSDKTIRIWQVQTGECLQILRGHTGSIWSAAFSPDGRILASGSDESNIRLWDTQTGELLQTLAGDTGSILALAFQDEHTLASGSADGTIRVWNLANSHCETVLTEHSKRVWSIAFSPDGKYLASGSADGTIKLWSGNTCISTLICGDRVRAVRFSPDGNTLVSSDDQVVRLWNIQTGECLRLLQGHSDTVFSVAFNADGQTIVSGSADQTVRFWQAGSGRCFRTMKGYTNSIFSVAFSPNGETIASGSTDQTIRLWQGMSGEHRQLQGHSGWVTSVAFHPQNQLLASTSADQTVRIWSIASGKCLKVLRGHTNWVQSAAFSPAADLLASGGDDCTIRLWSVESGNCLSVLTGHTGWIWSVAFASQTNRSDCDLASGSDDGTVRLWSTQTGACLRQLTGHTAPIYSIAFSPDGERLASSGKDETVRIWDVASGDCQLVIGQDQSGHENNVWSVAFSPDSKLLASGSLDQTVRIWDVQTGRCLQTLPVINRSVRSAIAFDPAASSYRLATGSHSEIQLWDALSGDKLHTLTPARPYQGTNIANVTGLTGAQKEALKAMGAVEE